MQWRSGSELREMFLRYFEEKGSRRYPSFSLVPDDPTLLFTIAGMVPFKPYFLGLKTPEVTRATTAQKCIRTNDIDNVGRTARHHTLFEMLGNFSFGDYFKKEVIPWAWTLLTERVGLEPERMWVTVYRDDDEAADIWHRDVGISSDRIIRMGEEDNFWAAGPVGPCGPCSELLYDQGPEFSCGSPDCAPGCSCDRYLEIWNLVFMQYERREDGSLIPLPKKNIDTGMGLERLASVVQRVRTDFETDLFRPVVDASCVLAGIRYGDSPEGDLAVRVIADHLRASAFMIADGILPMNEGPGYVLRRLIRRAVRFGRLIGIEEPFLLRVLPSIERIMADPYRELVEQRSTVEQVLALEERRFVRTLEQGSALLEQEIAALRGRGERLLPGELAFTLYDTYGFPCELTREIASESGVDLDEAAFRSEMEKQRDRARAASKQTGAVIEKTAYTELADELGATPFLGYGSDEAEARVLALVRAGERVSSLAEGEEGDAILDRSPFYAERGGQVGDRGTLSWGEGSAAVLDTRHPSGELIAHSIRVERGALGVGALVRASVDAERRNATRRHHTATHLLHEALGRILGSHVRQAGSWVGPDQLRFDFNHFAPLTPEEIRAVELLAAEQVLADLPVETVEMDLQAARNAGAKALFEEKYGDRVRVVSVQGFSRELCGGTHVDRTGRIGPITVIREEGIGSGIRRLTALAGMAAVRHRQERGGLREAASLLGGEEGLIERIGSLLEENRDLRRSVRISPTGPSWQTWTPGSLGPGRSGASVSWRSATTGPTRSCCGRSRTASRSGSPPASACWRGSPRGGPSSSPWPTRRPSRGVPTRGVWSRRWPPWRAAAAAERRTWPRRGRRIPRRWAKRWPRRKASWTASWPDEPDPGPRYRDRSDRRRRERPSGPHRPGGRRLGRSGALAGGAGPAGPGAGGRDPAAEPSPPDDRRGGTRGGKGPRPRPRAGLASAGPGDPSLGRAVHHGDRPAYPS
jgi:alanyl-tRNA synthetase